MPRPSGLPKTGGRKLGTPNKRTRVLSEVFERLKLDVPAQLHSILPKLPYEKQADVLLELMNYLYPKRRPQESDGQATGDKGNKAHNDLRS